MEPVAYTACELNLELSGKAPAMNLVALLARWKDCRRKIRSGEDNDRVTVTLWERE